MIQSGIENYLFIKDKVVSSLLSSKDNEHPKHLIADGDKGYLKPIVIYGANASGKFNVLNAFWFMVNYVLTSRNQQLHKTIARSPFRFNPEALARPSSFKVISAAEGVWYVHGFSVTGKAVTEEYPYYYPNDRQALIFEKKDTKDLRFATDVDEQSTLRERISVNKLYLSVVSNWSYAKVIPVLKWFTSCRTIMKNSVVDAYGIGAEQLKNNDYRRVVAFVLRVVDLGIQALQMHDSDLTSFQHNDIFADTDAIHTVHNINGNACSYALNMAEESDGTNSYSELIGVVKKVLDLGALLVVDEMGTYLHLLLAKHLVSFFDSTEFNPKDAQLVFTPHSTNLLDLDFLRRDQIWFTERDEQAAAADLFSLYGLSIRKDIKVEKGYLIDRFGAIPLIKGRL